MKLTIHNQYPFLTSIRLFWPDTKLPLRLTWRNGHPGLWSSKKSVISYWLYTPHSTLWHTVGISCGSISSWDVGSLCLVFVQETTQPMSIPKESWWNQLASLWMEEIPFPNSWRNWMPNQDFSQELNVSNWKVNRLQADPLPSYKVFALW